MNNNPITHLSCLTCGSSDAMTHYPSDGHSYCFSCGTYFDPSTKDQVIIKKPLPSIKGTKTLTFNYDNIAFAYPYRGLTKDVFDRFGVRPAEVNNHLCLVFPTSDGAAKVRRTDEKSFFTSGPYVTSRLFGMDLFERGSAKAITITEGEIDAISVYKMLGDYPVVSIKNGAQSAAKDCAEHRDYLNSFDKIYICFDNDEPGRKATSEVARMFNSNKVYIVNLGKYKDANEYLQAGAIKDFTKAWWAAERFRPKGIISSFEEIEGILDTQDADAVTEYPFATLEDMSLGIRLNEVNLITAETGVGKQLCVSTPIPTPNGWTSMGDLRVGDIIFGADGKPTAVTRVTPVQHDVECFKVTFYDGTSLVAGGPHKWGVYTPTGRYSVKTTYELMEAGVKRADGVSSRWSVPLCKPVEYPAKDLPVDPYLLGVWLGDGHSYSQQITLGEDKDELVEQLNGRGHNIVLERKDKDCTSAAFDGFTHGQLKELGLKANKHIPQAYLQASVEQRRELVRGLMDTDGCASRGRCEFYSSNETLFNGFVELARSLGYRVKTRSKQASYDGVPCKTAFTASFLVDDPSECFSIPRKIERLSRKVPAPSTKTIVSIDPCESVPSVCIQVDNPDHLYVVGDGFTVTHNTEFIRAIEYHILKNTDFNIGVIHLEEREKRAILGLATYELGRPAHRQDSGVSRDDAKEAFRRVVRRDDRAYFYQHFGSEDPDIILDTIRYLATACNCKFIFLDHITMLVTGYEGDDERKRLDYLSTRLAILTRELEFTLFLVSHVNDDGRTRGSRNIEKIADLWLHVSRDKESSDPEVRNTMKVVVKKNRFAGETGPAGDLKFDTATYKLSEKVIDDNISINATPSEDRVSFLEKLEVLGQQVLHQDAEVFGLESSTASERVPGDALVVQADRDGPLGKGAMGSSGRLPVPGTGVQ